MIVKALDKNRVKILMEDRDIEQFGLPFEKLNYEDPYSKAFIFDLMKIAREQTGVDFQESRTMVEVVPGASRSYYILMTKLMGDGENSVEFDKAEQGETTQYIYQFESGENLLRFCTKTKDAAPSELYYLNGFYYLVLHVLPQRMAELGGTMELIEEYGNKCLYDYVNEGILAERGELLMKSNVLQNLGK